MTMLELADKFEKAGFGETEITPEDLDVLGIKWQKSFTSKFFGRIKVEGNWENFCRFVYEKVTGQECPKTHTVGTGFRSQHYGRAVAKAIRAKVEQEAVLT